MGERELVLKVAELVAQCPVLVEGGA